MLPYSYEPDIELRIELTDNTFRFELHSRHERLPFHRSHVGEKSFQTDPALYMRPIFDRINQITVNTNTARAEDFQQELENFGYRLYRELIPDQLKQAYWVLHDFKNEVHEQEQRILSLRITSDEPWIPWEMLKPYETNREGDFLAATFQVCRWLAGNSKPKRYINIKRACVVAPELDLEFATKEYELFQHLTRPNVVLDPRLTTHRDVLQVAQDDVQLLHVATHGQFNTTYPHEAPLFLQDGPLLLGDLMRPSAKGLSNARPLVFLNTCHSGRMDATAFSVTGWAEHMVTEVGVGSFIGTYWSIDDRLANLFSQSFYENLLSGQYLGQAFYNARLSIRAQSPSNPTWLAYTLYGDPYCRVYWGDVDQNAELVTPQEATSFVVPTFTAQVFEDETSQGLKRVQTVITGVNIHIERSEVNQIEEQLSLGRQVIATGESGVGKSGIAHVLVDNAKNAGKAVLYLDCRRVQSVATESHLQRYFDLDISLKEAIQQLGIHQGCRLVVDQFDNTVGLVISDILTDLLLNCASYDGIEIVLISRAKETDEQRMLTPFTNATIKPFVRLQIADVTPEQATSLLDALAIEPTQTLIMLGSNLLNLELIAKIKETVPDYTWSNMISEVQLWEHYLRVIQERESPETAKATMQYAVDFAYQSLLDEGNLVRLSRVPTAAERRLISWGILVHIEGRVYQFKHEQLRDYLYAWDATEEGKMPERVIGELITPYRSRNVLLWMDKIYLYKRSRFYVEFARKMLNV